MIALFSDSSALRLLEPFRGYVVQFVVFNTKFTARCPEVFAVPDHADVEWIRSLVSLGESVCCLALREPVKAKEVHQEAAAAAAYAGVFVTVRVAFAICFGALSLMLMGVTLLC